MTLWNTDYYPPEIEDLIIDGVDHFAALCAASGWPLVGTTEGDEEFRKWCWDNSYRTYVEGNIMLKLIPFDGGYAWAEEDEIKWVQPR